MLYDGGVLRGFPTMSAIKRHLEHLTELAEAKGPYTSLTASERFWHRSAVLDSAQLLLGLLDCSDLDTPTVSACIAELHQHFDELFKIEQLSDLPR